MKSSPKVVIVLATAVLSLSACFNSDAKKDPKPSKFLTPADITIGMSQEDFSSIFDGLTIPANDQWTRPGEIQGLRGEWTYSFHDGHLSWFIFNSYGSEVDARTFRQYLEATQKTVASYTLKYGEPGQLIRGVREFKDPREGYPGYPVLKASWRTGDESLQVDYSVLGNDGENPQLLFTVEARR